MVQKNKNYTKVIDEKIEIVSEEWHLEPLITHSLLVNLGVETKRDVERSLQSVLVFLNDHPDIDEKTPFRGQALVSLETFLIKNAT